MNRRGFLRSLGIGVAGLYLRFAPDLAKPITITNSSGAITLEMYEKYLERIFRAPYRGNGPIYCYSQETYEALKKYCKEG